MASQKGLGRGLGALLGDFDQEITEKSPYQLLPIHKVEPNRSQPRQDFDEEELQSLSESIALHGVLQPLTVRQLPSGYYQIIAGERRWRAARMAGLSEVPVVVIEADDKKTMELALIENLQRQDLNPVEEALGYRSLIEEYGLTQEETSQRVGKSRSAVANALRLLSMNEELLEKVRCGELSPGHARAVLSVKNEKKQKEAEDLRKTHLDEAPVFAVNYIGECEKNLSKHLGRGVKIVNGKRKGRFELEFYGDEDLQNLLDALMSLKK